MKYRSLTRAAALLLAAALLSGCSPDAEKPQTADVPAPADASETAEEGQVEPEFVIPADSIVSMVDYDEIFAARTSRSKLSADDVTLYFDGCPLPRAGNKYYLTVDDSFRMTDLYSLTAKLAKSSEEFRLLLDEHIAEVGAETMMKHNTVAEVYLITDEGWAVMDLYFTTLPVITVESKRSHITTNPVDCKFSLFTYRNGGNKVTNLTSDATIKVRGASSASLAKTGFKIELQQDGQSRKMPLLGMRNDDDWILYPSYSDNTKVRDVVGWHLWEKMMDGHEYPGVLQTRYVEVILNDDYYGLFVLMEKFDDKTLGLKDGEALFKVGSWDVPTGDTLRRQSSHSESVSNVEKKFPAPEDGVDGSWDVFADYVAVSYETDGTEFAKRIGDVADIENQVDYWLFLNMTMAADNTWKNTYYAQIGDKIRSYPWDLDITFGLGWSGVFEENYLYENEGMSGHTYDFQCGRRLLKYVDSAQDYVKSRWKQLKKDGVADADAIIADAHEQWELIHNSGAFQRNLERWPATSATDSLDFFEKTVRAQMKWLDSYIAGIN